MTRYATFGLLLAAACELCCQSPKTNAQSVAIGGLRSIAAAEKLFASLNQGLFGTLEALTDSGSCIATTPDHGFLDAAMPSRLREKGYAIQFFSEPATQASANSCPGSVKAWAAIAYPVDQQSHLSVFCTDSTFVRVCANQTRPDIRDSKCPNTCVDLP